MAKKSLVLFCILLLVSACRGNPSYAVISSAETEPHPGNADDPAIWIHPENRAESLIIGAHKETGLGLYDLSGKLISFWMDDGGMNNVDLRYNFPLGGELVDLAVASRRLKDGVALAVYRLNAGSRSLEDVTSRPLTKIGTGEVGLCLFVSPRNLQTYAFTTHGDGLVQQWALSDDGHSRVSSTFVRSFDVGTGTEGCAADDVTGWLYIGEEDVGLWKVNAEPDQAVNLTVVDRVGPGGHLNDDVEGVTIYYAGEMKGYLLVSSQHANQHMIYRREGENDYVGTFYFEEGNGIDRVTGTDGVAVTNADLGPAFPKGLYVTQDHANNRGHNNFKLVEWPAIARGIQPELTVNTTWDPRSTGKTNLITDSDKN